MLRRGLAKWHFFGICLSSTMVIIQVSEVCTLYSGLAAKIGHNIKRQMRAEKTKELEALTTKCRAVKGEERLSP